VEFHKNVLPGRRFTSTGLPKEKSWSTGLNSHSISFCSKDDEGEQESSCAQLEPMNFEPINKRTRKRLAASWIQSIRQSSSHLSAALRKLGQRLVIATEPISEQHLEIG